MPPQPPRSAPFPYTTLFRSEPDDQGPPGREELPPREVGDGAHGRISLAARCTARTIRLCEAHRHRWPSSACLISRDRKSTRLNSSHLGISYAVFCLNKLNQR